MTNLYAIIHSNILGDIVSGIEDEVLTYVPTIHTKILPLVRDMQSWAKEHNSELVIERRVTPKKIIKKVDESGSRISSVIIATFYFVRKDGKKLWFSLTWNKI